MGARYRSRRSHSQVAWGVGGFAFIQLAVLLAMELIRPEAFDRESLARNDLVNARRAEEPDSDLLLVVGSSRIGHGVLACELRPTTGPEGRPVLPINYSHLAAGPRTNLM